MRPFNLKSALAGDRVVTRDGREATQLTIFDSYSGYPIVAVVSGEIQTFSLAGRFCGDKTDFDLFMKPVERSGWVNPRDIHWDDEGGMAKVGWEE